MLVYNRPEKYFPERDEILERQGATRPHWYVICIVLHPSSHFKIKVVDSWYVRNTHQKKTVIEEASIYLTNLIKIFLELKGKPIQGEIQIEEKHLNIIPSKMHEDKSTMSQSLSSLILTSKLVIFIILFHLSS